MLAWLGQAVPAAVLAGAVSAHFPASLSGMNEDERTMIDEAEALTRRRLGEAAYSAALGRGAAMDQDELVGYALSELRRAGALAASVFKSWFRVLAFRAVLWRSRRRLRKRWRRSSR